MNTHTLDIPFAVTLFSDLDLTKFPDPPRSQKYVITSGLFLIDLPAVEDPMLIHGHAEPARKHMNQPINHLGVKPTVNTIYHDPASTRLLPKTLSIIYPYNFPHPLPLPLYYDALPDFAFSRQFSNIAIHFENG